MGNREARIDLGWDLLEQGQFDGAIDVAQALLAEEADDAEASFLEASALFESGDLDGAESRLRRLLELEPESVPARLTLAALLHATCRFGDALEAVDHVVLIDPGNPYAAYLRGLILDMTGKRTEADACFARAAELEPDHYQVPVTIARSEFDRAVEAALGALPSKFRDRLSNLSIQVEEVPSMTLLSTLDDPSPDILGLFVGTPLTERGSTDTPQLPEAIYLFKRNLERACDDRDQLVSEIRVTLLHEIGHYLGMEESDLDEAGFA